jgi:hypothetical protein
MPLALHVTHVRQGLLTGYFGRKSHCPTFLLYDTDRIENDVAARTCLPSRLLMIGGSEELGRVHTAR